MDIRSVKGLQALHDDTLGDNRVCLAVLDGPVGLSHPCFQGADLKKLDTLVSDDAENGPMSLHGTHVASLLFGQPSSLVVGVAPHCRGLIVPIFRDNQEGHLSQLDLARAIEQAAQEGAHIINVSGGERSPTGQVEGILERALRLCADNNFLVVAAVGNGGCACLQVPTALPSVLAVGAIGVDEEPMETSNWGEAYLSNGVLAPGQQIDGAAPGSGTASLTGSSFATPVVSGVAALLLSIQAELGRPLDPVAVGRAILEIAVSCQPRSSPACRQHLVGTLNIAGATTTIKGGKATMTNRDTVEMPVPAAAISSTQAHANTAQIAGTNSMGTSDGGVVAAAGEPSPESHAPSILTPGLLTAQEAPAELAEARPQMAPAPAVTGVRPSLRFRN